MLLIIHSYDINSVRQQRQKFMKISGSLAEFISFIPNFKFAFITLVYYFENNFCYEKNRKKIIAFSLSFILKKIIINLRINNSSILLIYHTLIRIREDKLWDFCSYYLEDFILFFFDYLWFIFALIFIKIMNKCN